jgi:hypothetical protein
MGIFKTHTFARFACQESMPDEALANAIRQAERGLVAAQLGGGLIKLRAARPGSGKSGGYRTIIAYNAGRRAVFLFGFAKNERDNLTSVELADLKMVGRDLLALTEPQIKKAVAAGQLQEVRYDEDVQDDGED